MSYWYNSMFCWPRSSVYVIFVNNQLEHNSFMFCWPCSSVYVIFVNNQLEHNSFSCMFIFILYMFQAAMCPSLGELIVSIRHLVYVTLYRRPSSIQSDIYQMSYWYNSMFCWPCSSVYVIFVNNQLEHNSFMFCWPCSSVYVIFVNNQLERNSFSCMFISILYMFQAAMCPSSGELIVSIRHLVYVTLYRRPSSIQSDIYQMSYWYN